MSSLNQLTEQMYTTGKTFITYELPARPNSSEVPRDLTGSAGIYRDLSGISPVLLTNPKSFLRVIKSEASVGFSSLGKMHTEGTITKNEG